MQLTDTLREKAVQAMARAIKAEFNRPWDETIGTQTAIERAASAAYDALLRSDAESREREGWPELSGIDAERDEDGEITVFWKRGDDMVSLVCRPDGSLIRIVSMARPEEPVIRTHVLALSAAPSPTPPTTEETAP